MATIISDEALNYAILVFTKVLSPVVQVIAIFVNVINVITFNKIGLRDGVNITFLCLSVSDLAYVTLDASKVITLTISLSPWQRDLPVSTLSLSGIIQFYQYIFMDTSTCLETYLAITRCCCVAMPLQFRDTFTFYRTMFIITCIFLCNTLFRMPLLTSYCLTWQTSPLTNLTKLTFTPLNTFQLFNNVELVVGRTIFPVTFLVISILCSVILTRSLIKASVKRNFMTFVAAKYRDKGNNPKLSSKELQMVKATALVITVLGVLQLILSMFSLTQAALPEFFPGKRLSNIHTVFTLLINLLINLHCAYKIIIYVKLNTRYRALAPDLFSILNAVNSL
ncbi:5-hydroxytryptamine receptor 2 [Biomphalaria glabrata]|nr:5-hydroxytryptamine receptor 2 [Biomphalaria glabrata]